MYGWQVKLCDPLVAHRPYLSALEIKDFIIKCYINSSVYLLLQYYLLIIIFKFNCKSDLTMMNFFCKLPLTLIH